MKGVTEFGDYERVLAERFMKANPGIEVRTQCLNWEDLPRKVPISIMAGSPPDILLDFNGRTSGYWYQGVLEPLDELVDPNDDFRSTWIADHTIDGKLHNLPLYGGSVTLAINRAMWKKVGKLHLLPSPDKPVWTMKQFEAALRAIAVPNEVYPLSLHVASEQGDYSILQFFWCRGAKMYENRDYSRVVLNSKIGIESLSWLLKAHRDGLVPPNITAIGGSEFFELFYRGGSGCIPAGAALEQSLATAKRENRVTVDMDLMFAMTPTVEGQPQRVVSMTGGLCVFKQKNEEKKRAVLKFVKFLAEAESLEGYAKGAGVTVSRTRVKNPFVGTRYGKLIPYIESAEPVDMGVLSQHYYAIRRLLPPQLQAAFLGRKTPREALDAFCREAHTVVEQAKEAEERAAKGSSRGLPPWPVSVSVIGVLLAGVWIFRRQLLAP